MLRRAWTPLLWLALMIVPASAWGFQDRTPLPATPPPSAPAGPGEGGMLRFVIMVVVVCALIYGLFRLLRALQGQAPGGSRALEVEVLSRTALARDTQVLVVRVGDQVQVLTSSPGGITCLRRLSAEAAAAEGLDLAATATDRAPGWRRLSSELVQGWQGLLGRLRSTHHLPDQPVTVREALQGELEQERS